MINALKKIKPFLRETSFLSYRTRVGISFYQRNNTPYIDGSVAYEHAVIAQQGKKRVAPSRGVA
jgi:hypothetical protein